MNLDKYEKIDNEKLLEVLEKGNSIFSEGEQNSVDEYKVIDGMLHSKLNHQVEFLSDRSDVLWFLQQDWYIKKPFDVRQAMFDRPNEWVAAFNLGGVWMKLGFDEEQMMAVEGPFDYEGKANMSESASVGPNWRIHLDKCIPIEDVPKEANQ